MHVCRGAALFAAWVLAGVLPTVAHAQEAEGRVVAVADAISSPDGATCLAQPAIAEAVARWLGRDAIDGALSVVVAFASHDDERTGVSFVVVRHRDVVSRRVFPSLPAQCSDRRAVVALAIAIALDATLLESLGVTERAPAIPPASASRPVRRARGPSPAPVTGVPSRARLRLWASVEGGVALGALAEPTALGGASIELGQNAWVVRATVGATPSVEVPVGRGFADVQLALARLDVCLLGPLRVVALEGCLGAAPGLLVARGRRFARPESTDLVAAFAAARIAARYPRDGVISVRLALDGTLSLVRPALDVRSPNGELLDRRESPVAGAGVAAAIVVRLR